MAVLTLPAPMLATNGRPAGDLEDWAIEPKLDGYRTLIGVSASEHVVRTRGGCNITAQLPELGNLRDLGIHLVLDGELIDGAGRPEDFYGLAGAIAARQRREPLVFVAFDLLACNGNTLLAHPHHERRLMLEHVARLADGTLHIVPSYPGPDLDDLLAGAHELALEGLVVKHRHSPYKPGNALRRGARSSARTGSCIELGASLTSTIARRQHLPTAPVSRRPP